MRRALAAVMLAAVMLLTGCSGGDGAVDPPVVSESPTEEAEPEIAAEQQFSLDDTAQFDDGLEVEIAGSLAAKAGSADQGAESTDGEIVTASVRIGNNTTEPYDPRNTTITASYGDLTVASPVINPAEELTGTFTEVIAVDDEGVAAAAFAIPADGLDEVVFVVDLQDDTHEPMSFSGGVVQG